MDKLQTHAEKTWNKLNEKIDIFPSRSCKFAVRAMYSQGYDIIQGVARVDNYCGIGISKDLHHYWNRDKQTGEEFDITASQFNPHLSLEKQMSKIERWFEDNHPVYKKAKQGLHPNELI